MVKRGLFITLEGGEGAGKTTQGKYLADALRDQGHTVVQTREPGGTEAGEALRQVFIDHQGQNWPVNAQILLMFAARTLHVETVIKPALADGQIVICDRFTDSTRAYQGHALGYEPNALERIKRESLEEFEPDLTLIFDLDPREGLKRTQGRGTDDTFEDLDMAFHDRLRQGFLEIAGENPERCVIIDAAQSAEEVAMRIF